MQKPKRPRTSIFGMRVSLVGDDADFDSSFYSFILFVAAGCVIVSCVEVRKINELLADRCCLKVPAAKP
jgi:hypothetical protein